MKLYLMLIGLLLILGCQQVDNIEEFANNSTVRTVVDGTIEIVDSVVDEVATTDVIGEIDQLLDESNQLFDGNYLELDHGYNASQGLICTFTDAIHYIKRYEDGTISYRFEGDDDQIDKRIRIHNRYDDQYFYSSASHSFNIIMTDNPVITKCYIGEDKPEAQESAEAGLKGALLRAKQEGACIEAPVDDELFLEPEWDRCDIESFDKPNDSYEICNICEHHECLSEFCEGGTCITIPDLDACTGERHG